MTKQAQRTPGRWRVDQCTDDVLVYWLMHDGVGVGKLFDNAYVTSPAQIQDALNSHDALVAALRDIIADAERGQQRPLNQDDMDFALCHVEERARAALAAADKGE